MIIEISASHYQEECHIQIQHKTLQLHRLRTYLRHLAPQRQFDSARTHQLLLTTPVDSANELPILLLGEVQARGGQVLVVAGVGEEEKRMVHYAREQFPEAKVAGAEVQQGWKEKFRIWRQQ